MISIDKLDLDFDLDPAEVQIPIDGWTARRRIFPIMQTTCDCGATYSAPCPPRVRERHRNGTYRESINHPRIKDSSLPAKVESYSIHISACPQCQAIEDPSHD